jgi:hypothetical protein
MKKILFFLFFSLQCLLAEAWQEEPPSAEFVRDVESLSDPAATDTATTKTVMAIGLKRYTVSIFKRSTKYAKRLHGIAGAQRLNELIDAKSTAAYKKLTLINGLRGTAIYLCRKDFNFALGEPSQHKIAYSWGSKDHSVRRNPPGYGNTCTYPIHGLDCSGFVYQLFYRNGVMMPAGQCNADTERKQDFLRKHLAPYFGDLPFDVRDMGALAIKDIQSGDLIYFKSATGNVYHIGVLFVNDAGEVTFYQSIGQPNRGTDHASICQTNMDDNHGPTVKKIDKKFLDKNEYSCVRIIAEGM